MTGPAAISKILSALEMAMIDEFFVRWMPSWPRGHASVEA